MTKKYIINELMSNLDFNQYNLIKTGHDIYLTNYEISILKAYNIDCNRFCTYQELLFSLSNLAEEDEDIESIINSISERSYYQTTKK